MPEPQDPPGDRLFSANEFAGVIRKLYPSLGDATPDDNKLTSAILKVHPEFRDHVIDPMGGMEGAPKPAALPNYGAHPAAPPSPIALEGDQTPVARRASAKGGPGNVATTAGELRAGARRQDESYAGQFFASPVTGAVRAAKGAKTAYDAPTLAGKAGGAADVIGGVMEAATPFVPGALVEAPLAVGTGLLLGTGASTGVEKAGEAMNAPPGYVHLASELAGLAAGVAGGEGAAALKARSIGANEAFRTNLSRATDPVTSGRVPLPVDPNLRGGTGDPLLAGSQRGAPPMGISGEDLSDSMMLDAAKQRSERRSDDQSLHNVLEYKNQQFQDQEFAKLQAGIAENQRLTEVAKQMKVNGPKAGSAFDAIDRFNEGKGQPPAALPAGPEPAGLLGPGSPASILAEGSDQVYPGPSISDPNVVDVTDPSRVDQRPVAASEAPPPPLVQTLGEQLSSEMSNQPPAALQPRPTAETRVKMADRQAFKDRHRQVISDAVSEMEDQPHVKGRSFSDQEGSTYTPPIAGSDWYWKVVGKETQNPPSRSAITEYMRAFKDSDGKITGKELTDAQAEAGAKALGLKTSSGFRRAYEEWAPDIAKQVRNRTTAILGYERVARERAAADAEAGNRANVPVGSDETGPDALQETGRGAPPAAVVADGAGDGQTPARDSGNPPPPLSTREGPPWQREQPKLKVVNPAEGKAPASDHVRLYRGQGVPTGKAIPEWVRQGLQERGALDAEGRWFTDDPEIAKWYKAEAGETGHIVQVDVPRDVAERARVAGNPDLEKFSRDPNKEFFLAPEDAKRAARGPEAPPEAISAKLPDRSLSPGQEQGIQDLGDLMDALHPDDEFLPGNGEIPNPKPSDAPQAEFLAHGPDGPLYNVKGGELDRSTVSAARLKELGIAVPDTPAAPPAGERVSGGEMRRKATEGDTLAEDQTFISEAKELAGSDASFASLSSFFEKMKGEEGHLVLNIGPKNKRGLKEWLDRHSDEYGEEEWHQRATQALEDGDPDVAWRIAAMASARSIAAAGGDRGSEQRKADPMSARNQRSMSAEEVKEFKDSPAYKRRYAALAKELGGEVPKGIDINESGQMTFGPPEKNLKAAATDLLLGKNFAADVIAAADPTKIIRIAANRDPEMRINRQIAEQLVKSMPDEIVEPLLDLLKIEDRAEFAKHFARTVSSWGKGLRMLKDWQDENWNDMVHIANPRPEGIGMGAAALDEIRSTGGFVKWLGDASAEDRAEVGFGYPKNIKEGTPEAKKFAEGWYRAREAREARKITLAKTIGELAESGSAFDKALIAGSLEPAGTKSRGTLDAVENTSRAFVISQPVTLIRNMWTQAGRYTAGVFDDALASAYSMAALDPKGAARYFDRGLETVKAVATPGNVSGKMLKTPWLDSLETTYDYMADSVAGLPPEDMRKTIALMDQFPRRASQFGGGLALENGAGDAAKPTSKIPGVSQLIDPKVRNFVTVLGRTQEMAFRGSVFDSSVRSQLRAEGLDPSVELSGDPTKLIAKLGEKKVDAIIGGAVASALDYTFAAKPYPGSIPSAILHTFSDIPVFSALLRMGFPFPRFNWVSAPRWIYDHSPLGLADLPMAVMGQFTSEGAPFKGRLYRGLEAQKIQDQVIPHLASQIGTTEYTIATKQQEFVRAKVEAQAAAKSFKGLEARAAKSGMLPEIHDEIVSVGNEMQDKIRIAQEAKQAFDGANTQLRELKKQQRGVEEKLLKIKEIGAPTTAEYFARQTTGMAMIGAAYMIRSSDGAKDTNWYEYNVEAPGFGKHTLDLRSFAPMAQYLLVGDLLHSVQSETNWKDYHKFLEGHPNDYEGAITHAYHGRYTGKKAVAETANAMLSIAPAAGTSAAIIDYLTGRGGTNKQGVVQTVVSAGLGIVGQFLGRFTTPLRPLKDIAGQFDPEEAKARIPEESSNVTHHAEEVYGPALANLPYASEAIPEKKSPLTGEAIQTVNPLARAFAGLSEHDRTRIETEIAHTGIEYSKLVPRQTGDREFDNAVAEAYHQGLIKYSPMLLDHPQYQGMNPEIRREILGNAFNGLKQWALAEAGKKLGLDAAATHDKTEAPAAKQKRELWKGYLRELQEETQKGAPPDAASGQPQASNAPPPGLPYAQGGGQRFDGGSDARPPAGL